MVSLVLPILLFMGATSPANSTTRAVTSHEVDHLLPSSPWPRPEDALIRYLRGSYWFFYNDNLTVCSTRDGKYIIKVWKSLRNDVKASAVPINEPPPAQAEREVPKDIALSACQLWAHALANVRDEVRDKRCFRMVSDGGWAYFAGVVPEKGWTQGRSDSPLLWELPPKWMEQAGDALMEFGWHGNAPKCRKTLEALRQKLLDYEKSHP